ncbi:MAG TPA: DUF6569 family protein [Acidimicrobiales bacterium]|nr:DUF6569 family protein [Acidimicrobiales bacterium]
MPALLDLTTGRPLTRGRLALYPLFSDAPPAAPYVAGPAAATAGVLAVREVDSGATVPELLVETAGEVPVLLAEGETLLGAKQNRTLNVTVLLAPGARTRIPVSCVEAGRWGAPQRTARSGRHAPMQVRLDKTRSVADNVRGGRGRYSDQAAVWSTVAGFEVRAGAPSETHALEDVHRARSVDVSRLVGGTRPLDGQRGVVVAIDGVVRAVDVFDRPETLALYWNSLMAGYALDAVVDGDRPAVDAVDGAVGGADVDGFLARLAAADVSVTPGVGLGEEVHVRGDDVVATGLRWDGTLVHLAAFALA